jgi:hypothetical protein
VALITRFSPKRVIPTKQGCRFYTFRLPAATVYLHHTINIVPKRVRRLAKRPAKLALRAGWHYYARLAAMLAIIGY